MFAVICDGASATVDNPPLLQMKIICIAFFSYNNLPYSYAESLSRNCSMISTLQTAAEKNIWDFRFNTGYVKQISSL